jgi:uncharacterized membrane protein YoaK (UPF0700 family)
MPEVFAAGTPSATRGLFRVALILAFAGGYGDAASYLLTKSFTGHITGNTVLFAVDLASGAWNDAWICALAVVAFLAGVAAAELFKEASHPGWARDDCRRLRWTLLAEIVLLTLATGCRWSMASGFGAAACVVLACVAFGIQNGALVRCGGVSVHTTFITGMATSLLMSATRRATGVDKPEDKKNPPATLAMVWSAFVMGALAGGILTIRYEVRGFAGILVPLTIAAALSWIG